MSSSPRRVGPTLLWLAVAYLTTTVLNTAISLIYTVAFSIPTPEELGVDPLHDPAYQATVPWHPLVTLIVYGGAAALLFRRRPLGPRRAAVTGLVWFLVGGLVDLVVWVVLLGDTRWGLPADDYYIGNQPWISLQYLAILLAPLAVLGVRRLRARRTV